MTDGDEASAGHVPVMRERVVELLVPALQAPGSVLVDATLGLGGHAEAILASAPSARLVGIDRDPEALGLARERLSPFADRLTLVHAVYDELPEMLDDLGWPRCRGSSSTSASPRSSSTSPDAASPMRTTLPSTCAWTRPRG